MADRTRDIWNDNDGEEKKPKKHRGLRRFLTFFLILVVVLGVVLFLLAGGTWVLVPTIAGVGTIITAFFMGPVIEFFNRTVARPMLNKGNN